MSSKKLVLITGATGHIGFRTMMFALEAGYHVRAAVRSPEKGKNIANNPFIKALNLEPSKLTFVTVPDFEADGANDEAVKDVDYIIHIASPIPSAHLGASPSEIEKLFIRPAVQGTLGMLSSAKKESSVRRVVITSSVVAIVPLVHWACISPPPPGSVYSASSRIPTPHAPFPNIRAAYTASKTASLNETEAWVKREKPHFPVVNVHPGYVIGPDYLKLTAKESLAGTNMFVMKVAALGDKSDASTAGSAVHVDDVARVHVGALDEEKVQVTHGLRSFITHVPAAWGDIADIVKREFPKEVESGLLKGDGSQGSMALPIDASETEEVFGFRFVPFEEQVKNVVGRYVELSSTE